jgi:hypothetical protein
MLENTFRKLDLLPPSDEGRETPTLLGPLERVNLNHRSSALCSLVLRVSDDGHSPETQ